MPCQVFDSKHYLIDLIRSWFNFFCIEFEIGGFDLNDIFEQENYT